MPATTPQIVLPIVLSASTTVRLILADSAVGPVAVNATLAAGTYRNDRRYSTAGNLARDICAALTTAETAASTLGTWAAADRAGDLAGRIALTRTAGDAADDVTSLQLIVGGGGGATSTHLGWDDAAARAPDSETVGVTAVWNAEHMAHRLWIPHRRDQIDLEVDESVPDEIGVATGTPVHETQDYYGSSTTRVIEIASLSGASVLQHYADDADYAAAIGAETGDPHCAWEAFRTQWRSLSGTTKQARWSPDFTLPSVYEVLLPRAPWVFATRAAVSETQRAPDEYRLALECTWVGSS